MVQHHFYFNIMILFKIFPRIKDHVKFIDQRIKLVSNITEQRQSVNAVTSSFFDRIFIFIIQILRRINRE